MTIDEAIKHCEEVAEEQEMKARMFKSLKDYERSSSMQHTTKECEKCASEHRQLAEWLKELKKLREIPDKLVPKYRDGIRDEYNRGANNMLEEVIDDIRKYMEEVNADEIDN